MAVRRPRPGYDHNSGWSQLADKEGFALLFPQQQRANNPNLCFNWFQPGDVRRDLGEVASIRGMIEAMVVTHNLDRKRIFISGLSAGGAMAAAMLASHPEVFAGGAIIAGLPYGSATTVPEAFDRMRGHGGPSDRSLQQALRDASDHKGPWPKITIWHGSADQTVAPSNAASIAAQWRGVHKVDELSPTYSKTTGILARQVWCDLGGEAVIEINMIAGMGHGTPVGDGLGAPAPFMLDVGISSTRAIAQFWGIADAAGRSNPVENKRPLHGGARPLSLSRAPVMQTPETRSHKPSRPALTTQHSETGTHGVKKIIEDALRAAGLMR